MKNFLNALTDSICVWNEDKKLVFLNKTALKRLGYKEHLLIDSNLNQVIKIKQSQYGNIICGKTSWGEWKEGEVEIDEIKWEGEVQTYGIIRWKEDIDLVNRNSVLQSFIDTLPEKCCIKDIEGRYLFLNQSYADMIGSSVEEAIGKKDSDFWPKENAEKLQADDTYIRKTHQISIVEEESNIKGKKQCYKITKFPVLDDTQEVKYVGVIIKNITLYKELKYEEIKNHKRISQITQTYCTNKKTHKRLEALDNIRPVLKRYFETEEVNIWIYDESCGQISPYFKTEMSQLILGREQVLSVNLKQIEPYLNEEVRYAKFASEFCSMYKHLELSQEMGDKYILHYSIIYRGEFFGILSMSYKAYPNRILLRDSWMKDICRQIALIIKDEKFSEELEEEFDRRTKAERDLKEFLTLSTDWIVEVDKDGYYKKLNSSGTYLLGWTEEELLQMRWQDHIHPDDHAATKEFIDAYIENNRDENLELHKCLINRYRCKDGTYKWLRWDGYKVKKGENLMGTAKDITYEKELQVREEAAKKVMQLEHIRTEFFANVSHEFKTPITIIMSVIQLIELSMKHTQIQGIEDLELEKYIALIRQNSHRLLRLVNNLIDITKIDAGYYKRSGGDCPISC